MTAARSSKTVARNQHHSIVVNIDSRSQVAGGIPAESKATTALGILRFQLNEASTKATVPVQFTILLGIPVP